VAGLSKFREDDESPFKVGPEASHPRGVIPLLPGNSQPEVALLRHWSGIGSLEIDNGVLMGGQQFD